MFRINDYLLVSLLAAAACSPSIANAPSPARVPDAAKSVSAIADDYLAALREAFPEMNTTQGIPGARHDRLTDNSAAAERSSIVLNISHGGLIYGLTYPMGT